MTLHNVYHFLHKTPALEAWEMPIGLEELARRLVVSGRLRIEAHEFSNFIRFSRPNDNINMVFGYREFIDPELIRRTRKIIKHGLSYRYSGKELIAQAKASMERLSKQASLRDAITEAEELKIARLLVQATHPIVIHLALLEQTEVFVSYAYNVGDMMDIQSWKEVGTSGGLQSTDGFSSAVFVSCGGNPLGADEFDVHDVKEVGDGFPARARMLVIAGQEFGHYADIIRNARGHKVARHTSDISALKATDIAHNGRQHDLRHAHGLLHQMELFNLEKIVTLEKHIQFFIKHKRKGRLFYTTKRKHKKAFRRFLKQCRKAKMPSLDCLRGSLYPASTLHLLAQDMLFNLAPKSEAYERDNPQEEDAIACVEALARIPQQAVKWGDEMTQMFMPALYALYYEQVIPACIQSFEQLSGQRYIPPLKTKPSVPLRVRWQRLRKKVTKMFKKG